MTRLLSAPSTRATRCHIQDCNGTLLTSAKPRSLESRWAYPFCDASTTSFTSTSNKVCSQTTKPIALASQKLETLLKQTNGSYQNQQATYRSDATHSGRTLRMIHSTLTRSRQLQSFQEGPGTRQRLKTRRVSSRQSSKKQVKFTDQNRRKEKKAILSRCSRFFSSHSWQLSRAPFSTLWCRASITAQSCLFRQQTQSVMWSRSRSSSP